MTKQWVKTVFVGGPLDGTADEDEWARCVGVFVPEQSRIVWYVGETTGDTVVYTAIEGPGVVAT